MIEWVNEYPIDSSYLKSYHSKWVKNTVELFDKKLSELTVHFVTDDSLLETNKAFLDHDYYTDIITFDQCYRNIVTGELFISFDRIVDNAKSMQLSLQDELDRVIIHGVLHLIGYHDKTAEQKSIMRQLEDEALNRRAMFHVEH